MIENFSGWHGQNGCGQSCDGTFQLTLSTEWSNRINWFFTCWYRSQKLKGDQKFIGWACLKIGVASLVMGL